MILIQNDPVLSKAFKSEEVKAFFKAFLEDLEDAHNLKSFIIEGAEKTYNDLIEELSTSFTVIKRTKEINAHKEVERSIDGVRFKLGDKIIDKVSLGRGTNTTHICPITRIYEDSTGLHVRLDCGEGSITWRNLSQIEPYKKSLSSILVKK